MVLRRMPRGDPKEWFTAVLVGPGVDRGRMGTFLLALLRDVRGPMASFWERETMDCTWTRRRFLAAAGAMAAAPCAGGAAESSLAVTLQTEFFSYSIGADGRNLRFVEKQSGRDYAAPGDHRCASVRRGASWYSATSVAERGGRLEIAFGNSGVKAVLQASSHPRHVVLEVLSVEGEPVDELVFLDVPLSLQGAPDEPFAACALARNDRTNVAGLPRPAARLRASAVPPIGLVGASVAICAAPPAALRPCLQEAVSAAPELPHSPLGGPWALDAPINRGSYLFNFDGITEKNVDEWIDLARSLGMNQIDFHGGHSFRFGDCEPNPALYPQGKESLKRVIDRLHAAGISAGLHTYAFFLAKNCPWVSPIPDPRLASQAVFTLAEELPPGSDAVAVAEPTDKVSTITGFFVRNSVTLRIDQELITFTGVTRQPPYRFTGCRRGQYGTKPAAHAKGAKVYHLKECFGLFVPDPHTTLFTEVAARTAEIINHCGFDMMYLDALDGEDILGGAQYAWHYGSRFVYEIWRRLRRPVLTEMSTFRHHLWVVRSRCCAWDHPNRSHKKFIDIHCQANEDSRRMFLPGELGWWALKNWSGAQGERTFPDDIEYLMAKCLGTDTGFALMGIDPKSAKSAPALPRLAAIIRRYEELRHSGQVPEHVKARLRQPGEEYTLEGDLQSGWRFRPVCYDRHKVESAEPWSSHWRVRNRFGPQPLAVRIEALMGAGPDDDPASVVLADFQEENELAVRAAQGGVTARVFAERKEVKAGQASACFLATNRRADRKGAWVQAEKRFAPPRDLSKCQGLGVWVHGDGQGQVLNFQLRSPHHLTSGIGDHYVVVDFTGWRYFELIEPEGARYAEYVWPYGDIYSIYRESVRFDQIESLSLWYNHLPPGKEVRCLVSPVKAIPLVPLKLVHPRVTIGGQTLVFPVEIPSGCYLEFLGPDDCTLYGPLGEVLGRVKAEGEVPTVGPGENRVSFQADAGHVRPRAQVTIITRGEAIGS